MAEFVPDSVVCCMCGRPNYLKHTNCRLVVVSELTTVLRTLVGTLTWQLPINFFYVLFFCCCCGGHLWVMTLEPMAVQPVARGYCLNDAMKRNDDYSGARFNQLSKVTLCRRHATTTPQMQIENTPAIVQSLYNDNCAKKMANTHFTLVVFAVFNWRR